MIVKSASGNVDLGQPENIRAGMVFDTEVGPMMVERTDGHGWCNGGVLGPRDRRAFLGMDPAHATRADCERFGLAPGIDAAGHGFARTRDGFAVDMRREWLPPGAVILHQDGKTLVDALPHRRASLIREERFIGLDARHARPEDVERLCCGALFHDDRGGCGERCTLAIGDHDAHEDIAAGVKWPDPVRSIPGPLAFASSTISAQDCMGVGDKVWSPGKASGLCPHCKTGHMERRQSRTMGTYMACIGGCGRTESAHDPAAFARKSDPSPLGVHFAENGRLREATTTEKALMGLGTENAARETDAALRARIRQQQREDSAMRRMLGIPEPGTPDWIRAKVREAGYGCKVDRGAYGPGTVAVTVYAAPAAYRDFLTKWLAVEMPVGASCTVLDAACPGCGCRGECSWRTHTMIDPDAVTCETCQCRWCGPATPEFLARQKETGQACPNPPATRPRVVVEGDVASIIGIDGTVHFDGDKVRVWRWSGDEYREMDPSEYDVVRVPDFSARPTSRGHLAQTSDNAFRIYPGAPRTITLDVGTLKPGSAVILRAPGGDPINLTPQAAALRAALPTIDALPWPAADRRALRDATHAVAEMVEATDGKAPAGLRGPVTEMLAALATAAHVGPAVIGEAVKARDAARAAMPRRTK